VAKLTNRVVFITGASSGIGRATALAFAAAGANLLICARREDRLEELRTEIKSAHPDVNVHAIELDVRDQEGVESELKGLPQEWQAIDILVNNAGLSRGLDLLHEGSIDDWDEMIDTNVKGLLYVTRAVLPGMVARGRGHVVNVGSIAGHEVYPKGNVYCGSKHAVDAITRGMRMDLLATGVKVTTIDPGLVETEFSKVRFHGDEVKANAVYKGLQPLTPDDIAETIVWAATRPEHVQIAEVIVFPSAQASSMHVHRETAKA
jgi:3-hydroxy acid dehydrogenase/malonic semialdehyde reductase